MTIIQHPQTEGGVEKPMSNAVVVVAVVLGVLGVVLSLGILIRAARLLTEVKALAAQAAQQAGNADAASRRASRLGMTLLRAQRAANPHGAAMRPGPGIWCCDGLQTLEECNAKGGCPHAGGSAPQPHWAGPDLACQATARVGAACAPACVCRPQPFGPGCTAAGPMDRQPCCRPQCGSGPAAPAGACADGKA